MPIQRRNNVPPPLTAEDEAFVAKFGKMYRDAVPGNVKQWRNCRNKVVFKPLAMHDKQLGRAAIVRGGPIHKKLMRFFPDIFSNTHADPNPFDVAVARDRARNVDVTINAPAQRWRDLGFASLECWNFFCESAREKRADLSTWTKVKMYMKTITSEDMPFQFNPPVLQNNALNGYSQNFRVNHSGAARDYLKYLYALQRPSSQIIKNFMRERKAPCKVMQYSHFYFFHYNTALGTRMKALYDGGASLAEILDEYYHCPDDDDRAKTLVEIDMYTPSMMVVGDRADLVASRLRFDIVGGLDEFVSKGSDLIFLEAIYSDINLLESNVLEGGNWMKIPFPTQSCINPLNKGIHEDNLCMLYCCLAHLHPPKHNAGKVFQYKKYFCDYPGIDGKDFPMDIHRIAKYERIFQHNITVAEIPHDAKKGNAPIPMYGGCGMYNKDINSLLITNKETGQRHFVLVKNPSTFLYDEKRHNKKYVCTRCWSYKHGVKKRYEDHVRDCGEGQEVERIVMPCYDKQRDDETEEEYTVRCQANRPIMKFEGWSKASMLPVVLNSDFEASQNRLKARSCGSSTQVLAEQEMLSFSINVVDRVAETLVTSNDNGKLRFAGEGCVRKFLDAVQVIAYDTYKTYFKGQGEKKWKMTKQNWDDFKAATNCHFCDKVFPSYKHKVKDHDHFTLKYRGAACNKCNLNARVKNIIPVNFQNGKNYDFHPILRELKQFASENDMDIDEEEYYIVNKPIGKGDFHEIECIPDNMQKFKAITLTIQDVESKLPVDDNLNKYRTRMINKKFYVIESEKGEDKPMVEDRVLYEKVRANESKKKFNSSCYYQIRFSDTNLFFTNSLEKVAESMSDGQFKYLKQLATQYSEKMDDNNPVVQEMLSKIKDEDLPPLTTKKEYAAFKLLRQKGFFPYEYLDGLDRLNETSLPPVEKFTSVLSHGEKKFTDLDQERQDAMKKSHRSAETIWNVFNMKTFKDYHDLYLETDVYLLTDCFENFRDLSMETFGLDPCHFITLPSMAFQAALKMTKVELELFTKGEEDLYQFYEQGIKGGLSGVFRKRYARANNHVLGDENVEEPSSYINYCDANSLYAYAMSLLLPFKGFKWVDKPESFDLWTDCTRSHGYTPEVDMYASPEIHDEQWDYPMFPDTMEVQYDMQSPLQHKAHPGEGDRGGTSKKLVANLLKKERYKVDLRTLQYAMERKEGGKVVKKGWIVTKIHRVIQFEQKAWLKPYIAKCIEKRAASTSEFSKDFFKLMCNAVFGKTMENVRLYERIDLVSPRNEAKFKRQGNSYLLRHNPVAISDDLYAFGLRREKVVLNKPIYAGFSILWQSKQHMYEFWYDTLKSRYGDRVVLICSDTDSFIFQVFTEDFYKDLETMKDQWDFSNFSKDHFLYSIENIKKEGKWKLETGHVPILEVAAVRAKMYSLITAIMFCKGGKLLNHLSTLKGFRGSKPHLDYLRAIFHLNDIGNKIQRDSMFGIRSVDHGIQLQKTNKVTICSYDDKMYLLEDGITQIPYGHWRIEYKTLEDAIAQNPLGKREWDTEKEKAFLCGQS